MSAECNVEKLPKWAQHEIHPAQDAARRGAEGTGRAQRNVAKDQVGGFHIRHMGNSIQIMWSADRGSHSMVVIPESGNMVRLKQGRG